ncbi:MAG: rod-binding protein [Deltaproteobacteria bacterium]|jgi:Rod binding domain-containing protein|nr:rod-binding protein [Deltaproteobacteria bacterium]
MSGINSNMSIDPSLAVKEAQDREMVRRKMEIDALRKRMTPEQDPKGKLREACQGFETIFIQKLWEQMRANVPKEGYLHSPQESMYQSMYDNEFAKKMAEAGGIGLGDMLYEQLSQSLGESSRSATPRVNPRLPIVSASGSPSSIKYAAGPEGMGAIDGQKGRPASLPSGIKPLYEDFDENADPQRFALPGRGGNPSEYATMDIGQHRPLSVRQAMAAAEYNASRTGADAQTFTATQTGAVPPAATAAQAGATNLTPGGYLDFETLSHDALQQESLKPEGQSYAPTNRPLGSASILSPEETRILQEALRENSGTAGVAVNDATDEGRNI